MGSQDVGNSEYGVAQAERLVARFNQFESCYDDSPYARFMLRMRRGTSWLARAEEELFGRETPDPDAAFVFYWITFNAAYADDKVDGTDKYERDRFKAYFELLLSCKSPTGYTARSETNCPGRCCCRSSTTSICTGGFGNTTVTTGRTETGERILRARTAMRRLSLTGRFLGGGRRRHRALRKSENICYRRCLSGCMCSAIR